MVPRATARSPRRVAVVVPLLLIGLLLGASPAAARTPVGPQLDKTAPVTSPPATPAPPQRQLPAPSTPPAPAPSYDVSYPQCDDALPDAFELAIVGVNGGRVYSPNPCLGDGERPSQLAWAGKRLELYANTANPGPRLSDYWPSGQEEPRPCDTEEVPGADTPDCAYDYGWHAAADSYRTAIDAFISLGLAEAGADRTPEPIVWWLDVETANTWRDDPALNVAALEGARDYLESVDVAGVGFYSTDRMWDSITGGTERFAEHPSWVAGASTLKGATRYCDETGFTGGPVRYSQYFLDGLDANHHC